MKNRNYGVEIGQLAQRLKELGISTRVYYNRGADKFAVDVDNLPLQAFDYASEVVDYLKSLVETYNFIMNETRS
jgi:hypothetical protein